MEQEPPVSSTEAQEASRQSEDEDEKHTQANKLFQTGVMLLYGRRKSIEKAIKCIQRAITFVDSNHKYWQFLGEAYYQRGSLNPAINCFKKSLDLVAGEDPFLDEAERARRRADSTYSKLRMSDIRLSVGHLDEAASSYNDIILTEPNDVAALIGLSKTKLQLARNGFSAGLVKTGLSHCMESLGFAVRAIKLCPYLCLTWKLASDCCLIQFVYGQRSESGCEHIRQFPTIDDRTLVVTRKNCVDLSVQFLCKALGIDPFQKSACLWHNLGISLYFKSTLAVKPPERNELLRRSLNCLVKALDLDRNNSQIKNSVGVVAFSLNLLISAQNFLVKSIQTNMSTSEIQFSNLGYMYLQKGEFRLAEVAFSRCQAEEPLYPRSWLGNALIDEQNNIDNTSYLRHCHKLENNYESQLMFATKIASLPYTEDTSKDLINALDCMKRMINYDVNSLEANNTLGILYERCNYRDQARACFETAYSISPQDTRVIFNKLRHISILDHCYQLNSNSVDAEFIKSTEKLINRGNREHLLNYIYYLFKNGDYKNVNSSMTNYLNKLPQEEIRSKVNGQILLGLAAKADGGDFKCWLFKNIIDLENKICIEAVINLLCLLLFGVNTKDGQLVDQVSNDLSNQLLCYLSTRKVSFPSLFHSFEGYWIRLAILCSTLCLKVSYTISWNKSLKI